MTDADDLRTRAREAAEREYQPTVQFDGPHLTTFGRLRKLRTNSFEDGFLAHAAQQPTREQIARAIYDADGFHAADTWDTDTQMMRDGYLHRADAVLALLNGADR